MTNLGTFEIDQVAAAIGWARLNGSHTVQLPQGKAVPMADARKHLEEHWLRVIGSWESSHGIPPAITAIYGPDVPPLYEVRTTQQNLPFARVHAATHVVTALTRALLPPTQEMTDAKILELLPARLPLVMPDLKKAADKYAGAITGAPNRKGPATLQYRDSSAYVAPRQIALSAGNDTLFSSEIAVDATTYDFEPLKVKYFGTHVEMLARDCAALRIAGWDRSQWEPQMQSMSGHGHNDTLVVYAFSPEEMRLLHESNAPRLLARLLVELGGLNNPHLAATVSGGDTTLLVKQLPFAATLRRYTNLKVREFDNNKFSHYQYVPFAPTSGGFALTDTENRTQQVRTKPAISLGPVKRLRQPGPTPDYGNAATDEDLRDPQRHVGAKRTRHLRVAELPAIPGAQQPLSEAEVQQLALEAAANRHISLRDAQERSTNLARHVAPDLAKAIALHLEAAPRTASGLISAIDSACIDVNTTRNHDPVVAQQFVEQVHKKLRVLTGCLVSDRPSADAVATYFEHRDLDATRRATDALKPGSASSRNPQTGGSPRRGTGALEGC